jgi:hypothetical protein
MAPVFDPRTYHTRDECERKGIIYCDKETPFKKPEFGPEITSHIQHVGLEEVPGSEKDDGTMTVKCPNCNEIFRNFPKIPLNGLTV